MTKHLTVRVSTLAAFTAGILCGAIAMGSAAAAYLGSSIFPDVPSGSFYDQAVGEMYGAGIIKGYSDGRFGPDDYVTRGQVAVMMKRLRDNINGVSPTQTTQSSSTVRSSSSVSSAAQQSSQATVTTAGGFHFTSSTFSIPDVASNISVSVLRSGGSKGATAVAYTLTGGTAIVNTDYSPTTGVLSFADGATSATITVHLIKNTSATGDRTMNLLLKSPTNGAVLMAPSSAVITLTHSGTSGSSSSNATAGTATGSLFTLSAAGYGVLENAGSATITVMRTGNTGTAVDVAYATSNGSAVSGTDYDSTSGTLSFASGETSKTFSVTIDDNGSVGGNKVVNLTLKNPTNGFSLGVPSVGTLTIVDDESLDTSSGSGSIQLKNATFSANESDGYAYVAVVRGGVPIGTAAVSYSMVDDTAHNNAEYVQVSGTLTFASGEVQKYIRVRLLPSGLAGEKSFRILISNVTGNAVLGTQADAKVFISGS